METQFEGMLARLQPKPEVVGEFPQVAAQAWLEQQGRAERQKRELTADLEQAKKLKAELLRAKLKGKVSQCDYEQGNAEFTSEIAGIERQLREAEAAHASAESFQRVVDLQPGNIQYAWQLATPEERVRVRQLLFQDGLAYMPDSGLSNTSNSCLFTLLEAMSAGNEELARPERFELPTFWFVVP